MKKNITALAAALITAVMLCSCGGKTADVDVNELFKAAKESSSSYDELVEVEADEVKRLYGIESDWYTDYSASVSGNLAYAEEIIVFKSSSSENAGKIKSALEKRIESRINTLEGYAEDEAAKLKKAKIKTKGDYVYLVVGEDNKKAEDAMNKLF